MKSEMNTALNVLRIICTNILEDTPSDLLDGLIKDVSIFTNNAEQIDDISILVLSRN